MVHTPIGNSTVLDRMPAFVEARPNKFVRPNGKGQAWEGVGLTDRRLRGSPVNVRRSRTSRKVPLMRKTLIAACLATAAFAVVPSLASAKPVVTHPTGTPMAVHPAGTTCTAKP